MFVCVRMCVFIHVIIEREQERYPYSIYLGWACRTSPTPETTKTVIACINKVKRNPFVDFAPPKRLTCVG